MLSFESVEEICESKNISLVLHPAIRQSVAGYEESFYVGLKSFLKGESNGLYYLPLPSGSYERLVFSKRRSVGGHPILRVDPVDQDGLQHIKQNMRDRE